MPSVSLRFRDTRRGSALGLSLVLVFATYSAAGCTDPSYREVSGDASAVRDASANLDAFVAPSATLASDGAAAAWWAPLREDYALRIRFFGNDRSLGANTQLTHELVLLAKVSVAGDGRVSMQTQRCLDHGEVKALAGLSDHHQWAFPERLAPEQFELVYRAGTLSSQASARMLGYTDAPADCASKPSLPRRTEQVWLGSDPCLCSSAPLPLFATDCRVSDADQDQQPGLTVVHTGLTNTSEGVRVKDDCQIVNGVISADGSIRASYVENYDYLSVSCGTSVCSHNDVAVCPLALNPVLFAPLPALSPAGETWDCAAVLDSLNQFFPSEMLSFPTGC